MNPLFEIVTAAALTAQLMLAIWLCAFHLPRRANCERRFAACIAAVLLILVAYFALKMSTGFAFMPNMSVITLFAYIALPLSFVFIFACCDVTGWTALFFATSAFAMYRLVDIATSIGFALLLLTAPSLVQYPDLMLAGRVVWMAILCPVFYRLYTLPVRKGGVFQIENRLTVAIVTVMILCVAGFDLVNTSLLASGASHALVMLSYILYFIFTAFILYAEFEMVYRAKLAVDVATLSVLMENERRQYEISSDLIDAINTKCHDIRHSIQHYEATGSVVTSALLDDIAREVNIYDSMVQSDSKPLDVILTEKGFVCEQEGIVFSCIADGAATSFMAPADVYSLFGNALDNAIEAVRKVDDPAKRVISLDVRTSHDMLLVHVENYYEGELKLVDGVPQTSKDDPASHGFGIKSMQRVTENYGGSFVTFAGDEIFSVNIAIPLAA